MKKEIYNNFIIIFRHGAEKNYIFHSKNHQININDKVNILMFAVKKANIKLLKTILVYKPEINAKDSKNRNGLFYGINSSIGDNPEFIIELIKNGINVNEPEIYLPSENIEGHSPLTLAAKLNYKNIVKILLENYADPNYQVKSTLNCCLHYAILKNSEEMTRMLIEAKANINILNKNDDTPINMALKGSNVYIYWLLANENEKFRIQKEVSKMVQDSELIDRKNCSFENLKIIMEKKIDIKLDLNINEGKYL